MPCGNAIGSIATRRNRSDEMLGWIAISISARIRRRIRLPRRAFRNFVLLDSELVGRGASLRGSICAGPRDSRLERHVLIIFAMSVIFQGLVWYTGTLYVAMAVHAIYDVIAGFAYLRLYKQTAPQVSSAAPASVV